MESGPSRPGTGTIDLAPAAGTRKTTHTGTERSLCYLLGLTTRAKKLPVADRADARPNGFEFDETTLSAAMSGVCAMLPARLVQTPSEVSTRPATSQLFPALLAASTSTSGFLFDRQQTSRTEKMEPCLLILIYKKLTPANHGSVY